MNTVHGIKVDLPAWDDWTVYRLKAPKDESANLAGQMMIPTKKAAPVFRANLVITKYPIPKGIPLNHTFDAPNQDTAAKQQGFKVLGTGVGSYLGQEAVWQDITYYDVFVQMQIFQRQVGIYNADSHLVVLTLTSDKKELDGLGSEMGLNLE